jgi:FHA domain
MAITCNVCGYEQNPEGAEFCDACGAELATASAEAPNSPTPPQITAPVVNIPDPITPPAIQDPIVNISSPQPQVPAFNSPPPITPPSAPTTPVLPTIPLATPQPTVSANASARLVAKQANAPVPEFSFNGSALIGIFDPDQGPVDIDLESFSGGETISRQHAEVYFEMGSWKVKDLGSTNGVFIKSVGQSRFNARITAPTPLAPGDEIAIAKVCFIFQSP